MRARINTLLNTWYRLTHPVYAAIWRKLQPTTVGVKAIVTDPAGRVLLVKTRYQQWWTLPGGGVHKQELPEVAAAREVREETGVRIVPNDLELCGFFSNFAEGKSDYIAVFGTTIASETRPVPGIEIELAVFFMPDALPEGTSPATRRRLEEISAGGVMRNRW